MSEWCHVRIRHTDGAHGSHSHFHTLYHAHVHCTAHDHHPTSPLNITTQHHHTPHTVTTHLLAQWPHGSDVGRTQVRQLGHKSMRPRRRHLRVIIDAIYIIRADVVCVFGDNIENWPGFLELVVALRGTIVGKI